jgi:hypothetical protein
MKKNPKVLVQMLSLMEDDDGKRKISKSPVGLGDSSQRRYQKKTSSERA